MDISRLTTNSDNRLVGIEIEIDSGRSEYRRPRGLTGWTATSDGSLRNGEEWILNPARNYGPSLLAAVQSFDDAVTAARSNMETRGSMHVHIQAHDLTAEEGHALCLLYTRFQREIDQLIAPSRRSTMNATWCKPHPSNLTLDQWKNTFHWNDKTSVRTKRGSRYWTVNCQPMSVISPNLRSVEFRQAGPTRKAINIYGWVSFCLALVKLCRNVRACADASHPSTNLVEWLQHYEYDNVYGVAEWVQWRTEYLNQPATPELIEKADSVLKRAHGIHHVSRQLNVPLAVAKRICEAGVRNGKLRETSDGEHKRYVSLTPAVTSADIEVLRMENAVMLRRALASRARLGDVDVDVALRA